jgi:sugar transferase EpsL
MNNFYREFFKRLFDIVFVFCGIIILLPLMLLLAIFVRFFLGTPILFKQLRPGFQGKPFVIYKFRTMKDIHDKDRTPLSDAERLTKFGKFLRKYSMDELPELFNVLKGDMNLVGPRPLLLEYLQYYTPEQARRHEVRPGITGWAQVNGRNAISWEEKFKLDIWYVDHRSFWLDLKILWLTVLKVFKPEGISQ